MKFYTSYFAQMRNFPKNMLSFSTAIWNPPWLPLEKDKLGHYWLDIPPLKPGLECAGLCNGKCEEKHINCAFLQAYRSQLNKLNFDEIITKITDIAKKFKIGEGFNDVDVAILVFETPRNSCSERGPIQDWFRTHGIEIEEWKKNE